MLVFLVTMQSEVIATEMITKPDIFTIWPIKKKIAHPLV